MVVLNMWLHLNKFGVLMENNYISRTNSVMRSSMDDSLKTINTQSCEIPIASLIKSHEMLLKTESSFLEACRTNDLEVLKRLLSENEDVNNRDQMDRSGLHYASANGHDQIVEQLLNSGADYDAHDKHGMTGLLWGAWFGHVSVIIQLMKSGINVSFTNVHGMNLIHCAALNNQIQVIDFIIDIISEKSANKEKYGLYFATKKEHSDFHDRINEIRFNINSKNKAGQTAFHLSAKLGHDETMKLLLPLVKDINDKDYEGNTPLYSASENDHLKIVQFLLNNGADVNAENIKLSTPLMASVIHNDVSLTNCLIQHKANINAKNSQGNTALHIAASSSSADVVQMLINNNCDINVQNNRLQTPLHIGVEKASVEVVDVLLHAGADLHIQEKSGKTALGIASRGSLIGIVDMIIKAEHDQCCDKENLSNVTQCQLHHYCFYKTSCNAFIGSYSVLANAANDNCYMMNNSKAMLSSSNTAHSEVSDYLKSVFWKLATKQLKPNDWKMLAKHWQFTENHIKAIEHQYTGNESYKEHGYRLLLIWYHSLEKNENPIKKLFEGLVAIGQRELAEQVRQRCNIEIEKPSLLQNYCKVS